MRRVLVTGSRDLKINQRANVFADLRAQAKIAGGLDKLTVIHGACPTGADDFAHQFCEWFPEVSEEDYPADWNTFGKAAGQIRNSVMVAASPDVCLAYPRGEARGTYDCVTKAKEAKIAVIFG